MIINFKPTGVTLAGNGKGYYKHEKGIVVLSAPIMERIGKITVSFDDEQGVVGKDGKTKFFNATANLIVGLTDEERFKLAGEYGVKLVLS